MPYRGDELAGTRRVALPMNHDHSGSNESICVIYRREQGIGETIEAFGDAEQALLRPWIAGRSHEGGKAA
ncbi:hypothetical protein [Cohnella nanjingensis]|uniref:Uncharacterized protein n=1 Tax=Cohnella nanjingensis TaxID=1387779 RepID=A0A7X0RTQ6_9BACL|nr:hypothetical protein [Cohnella nanjingensis]MBB6673514.1 hypothetical protein [Cohnella nanjingensis]